MTRSAVSRAVISSRPARRDRLHGAWWPATLDIERELVQLLDVALGRVSAVLGVALNREEWPGAPLTLSMPVGRNPAISWYGLPEPHLAVLHCSGFTKLALLVLPPDTPEEIATIAMLLASAPGNTRTTHDTLTAARVRAGLDDGAASA